MDLERVIFKENLRHMRERLDAAPPEARPRIMQTIAALERELAMFEASDMGAGDPWNADAPALEAARRDTLDWFHREYGPSSTLANLLDPRPGLMIVDVNPIYAAATGRVPADIAGRPLFVAFPDSSDDPDATGVANLYASLRRVAETGVSEFMPVQRYDTRDPDTGAWVTRYWRIENRAIQDDMGRLIYLLHLVAEASGPD